jgi:hypothetical protein
MTAWFLGLALMGCPAPEPVVAPGAPYAGPYAEVFTGWNNASAPAGGYWIKIPGVPKDEVSTSKTRLGDATTHVFSAESPENPKAFLMAITTDYPAGFLVDSAAAMDAVREGLLLGGGGGTLLDEKKVIASGKAARQYHIKGSGTYGMIARTFVVGDRVYTLSVASEDPEVAVWAEGWLDTFTLFE